MFTISRKLYSGFVVVLLFLGIVIAIGYSQISAINKSYEQLLDDRVKKNMMVKEMAIIIKERQIAGRGYLLTGEESQLEHYKQAQREYEKVSGELAAILNLEKGREIHRELQQLNEQYDSLMAKEFEAKQKNNTEEYMDILMNEMPPVTKAFNEKIGEFIALQNEVLEQERQKNDEKVDSIKTWMLAIGLIALLIGTGIAIYISRIISKPVLAVTAAAEKIASGDLTVEKIKVKNKDEIGLLAKSFNQMADSLRQVIRHVSLTSEQVAASAEELTASAEETSKATEQITQSMQEVASGAEKQVYGVEESSNAIQELSVKVRQIASNAQNVSEYMNETSQVAAQGGHAVSEAIGQMDDINRTVTHMNDVVKGLGERSKEIGQIVEVITGIAAQTNLLALNTAIEAARAGEHGRGFAVVADEVRKLAEQSAESAQQIAQLIHVIQQETDRAVEFMAATTQKVEQGMQAVDTTGESFKKIQQSVENVAAQITEVSAASQQMAAGTEQVVRSVQLISEIAEESASGTQTVSAASEEQFASMEEITAAALSLTQMAEELQELIGKFKV
ncbi:MAG: methyl-accepting chemotaxis protein [Ectobacillus sp.]